MEDMLKGFNLIGNSERLKGIIESILFISGSAVSIKDLSDILCTDAKSVKKIINEMVEEYKNEARGICILEFNDKVQLSTKPQYADYVKKLVKPEGRQNLSQAALETLAIVAYKQPITKAEIDDIRGVRGDRALMTLVERGLVKETGRMDTAGRPILYSTTDDFLKYFGFKNIKELPELIELNLNFEGK